MSPRRNIGEDAVAAQVGRNLARCRRRAGKSQQETANLADMHRTHIRLIERGERLPQVDTVIKLAAALEISAAELWQGIEWRRGTKERTGGFRVSDSSTRGD